MPAKGFETPGALPQGHDARNPGRALLRGIELFDRGAAGNLRDLTTSVRLFRALGLEDIARRAALQVLIRQEG